MEQVVNRWFSVRHAGVVLLLAGTMFVPSLAGAEDFRYPLSAAVTKGGIVYVADRNLPGVWKMTNGSPSVYFQASKKFRTPLNAIRCVATDRDGNLLACDTGMRQVYRFDKKGTPQPLVKEKTGIGIPMDVVADSKGNLFISDLEVHWIWKLPAGGGTPTKFAEIPAPRGLAIDKQDRVWVIAYVKDQIRRISPDGKVEVLVRGRPFRFPHDIVLDDKNVAYVSDGYGKTIWKIAADGKPQAWITGKPLVNPVGLAWKGRNLLIIDPRAGAVFEATPDGKLTRFAPKKK